MKKIYTLTFLIIASIIGAGFASGKEIYVFFTSYGIISFVNVIIAFFLFYFTIKLYIDVGHEYKPDNVYEINKIILGKYYGIFNIFFIICYLVVLAGMFAGVMQVYVSVFSTFTSKIFVIITVILCIIETIGGIERINKINNIFMPITAVLLIISAIITIFKGGFIVTDSSITVGGFFGSLVSTISYIGVNLLLAGGILMQIGKFYSKTEIKKGSLFSSLILLITIFLFNMTMLKSGNISEMPMLTLAFNINYYWGIAVLIGIWFCIYSAITSMVYVLSGMFNIKIKNTFISNLIVVVIGYVISMLGFSSIVTFFYPVIGVVGIVFTLILIKTNILCKREKTKLKRGF